MKIKNLSKLFEICLNISNVDQVLLVPQKLNVARISSQNTKKIVIVVMKERGCVLNLSGANVANKTNLRLQPPVITDALTI